MKSAISRCAVAALLAIATLMFSTSFASAQSLTLSCATGTGELGVAFSSALQASGGTPPYTFSIVSGALPTGLSLDPSSGDITGTASAAGSFNYTANVTDSAGGSVTVKCNLKVQPSLEMNCPPEVKGGVVGQPYSSTFVVHGGVPPFTFTIVSGSLPPGLTLNSTTGVVSGIPTMAGSFTFAAQVMDSLGVVYNKHSGHCLIVIGNSTTVVLTCASSTGQVGVAYNSALVAAGGTPPYTFSITSGSLPAGLSLNSSTGAITGTPTTAGTFNFTAQVVDSTGTAAGTATTNCSIVISPPTITLACATSTGQVGVAYSSALVASGGVPPYTFSITSGSLPAGLTLNPSTGAITGTPTTNGTFNFTAKVVDSTGTAAGTTTANCSIVISPPNITLVCPSGTGQVGVAYSSALVAGGGVPPYTFSITSGSLPAGLTLNPSTGAITGTPTTFGTFNFTAKVVDSTGSAAGTTTASCSIVISPPAISLACATSTGQVGVAYSSALVASGGVPPYTFSITSGSLPPGLTLNPSTGAITGTPTTYGTFNFTAKVVDSTGSAAGTTTANCSIVIAPPAITLACATSTGQVGVAYSSALVATGGVPPYTFSIVSGSLPPGLTLNPSTGAITGTPTTYGTFNFTAKVVDSTGSAAGTTTANCSIVIAPPAITLACATSTGQVGVAYSSSLVATGGVPPYTYSITSGSLPPGLTLNPSTGAITGTPTTYGTFNFTAQVVDSTGTAAGTTTANCSIVIAPPAITLACATSTGQVGVAYSSSLVATGGVPPYTYSITSGSLPPGLTLNPSTGAITGTPTTYGTFNFTAQVVDSTNSKAGTTTANCSIVIAPPPITLACATSTGQVGVAYSSSLVATGGVPPYTYSITSGSLPPGLTLNPSTGAITGTPTTYGTFNFTAQVVDSTNSKAGTTTANCSIVIAPPPITLACATSTGQVGVAYSSSLVATGGVPPYTYSITSGSLPPGLTLNPSTGAITGTPTTYGTFNFTAQVVDFTNSKAGTTTANCSIVIAPPAITLACATSTGQVGVAYSSSLVASGGVPPYTYSITSGSLPPGLTLNPSTGAITGTPTTYGTFNFTAQVVDSTNSKAGTTTANCSIVIAPPAITLACATSTGQVGVAYSSSLVATGGVPPYAYSITSGSLPAGLTLNPSTGAITGTPTTYGTFNFTAQVVDSTNSKAGTTTANCSIVIAPPAITLACATSTGQVGVAYSSSLVATGGVPPYTYSITSGSLPPGLTLNPSTGAITGTPTTYGTFNFTAQVVDSTNSKAGTTTANCSIVIAPPAITLACPTGTGQVGVPYSSALVATGGVAPYTFSITSGSLPSGLTLNPSTGAITGTPTAAGTFNFTAKVVDSTGTSAGTTTANCSIVISPPNLTLVCPSNSGTVGLAYSSAAVATGGTPPYTFSIASGSLPPGLTLNTATGAITGTPSSEGTFSFSIEVTDHNGYSVTVSCTIVIKTCGTSLMPITYTSVDEQSKYAGQIIWFNSHLEPLSGKIPSSTFQIYITNGKIAFGSTTLSVPDSVITFSSSATCAQTSFNTTFQRWETTIPLSQASNSGIFAAGLAYLIPSGFQGFNSFTWTADISATAPGINVTWQTGASNWLAQNQGYKFPALSWSPFVPDYNGMEINPAEGIQACSFNGSSDHTGSPEFSGRSYLLVSGGCGQGSGNWTGNFSCAPQCVQVCTPGSPACLALPVNNVIQSNSNFAGIGLDGVDFEVQGPIAINGNVAVGSSGLFHLSNNAWLNSTLFADPGATVKIDSGSGLAGGEVTQSFSAAQTAAITLSSWAAGLTPTQTISSIQSSTTITGNGGQNVINVGYILMNSGGTITIQGGALDTFIINVQSGMVLGGGASIVLSGVQPAEVLFNFPGGTGLGLGSSTTAGIFLSPNNEIYISAGNHNSEFIAGSKLVLDCNNTTITAPACGQTGTPIVPYLQVNNGSWQETNNVTVSSGACVNLGPQPTSGGSWSWTGPNGYTSSSRQINSIPLSKGTNVFTAIYTNSSGVQSSETFTITVN